MYAQVRLFPYLDEGDEPLSFSRINQFYEFVYLSNLIKDKTSYNDYYLDEEDIITDILKDQIQGIAMEKGDH